MSKPHITYEDYPLYLSEPLRRAGAEFKYDEDENMLTITSTNANKPLTNNEKIKLCEYLVMRNHWYKKVHFESRSNI